VGAPWRQSDGLEFPALVNRKSFEYGRASVRSDEQAKRGAQVEQAADAQESYVTDVPAITTPPKWNYFVSNEQVLRRGLAIGSNQQFTRDQAIALGKILIRDAQQFAEQVQRRLQEDYGAESVEILTDAVLNEGKRIIVNLPTICFMLEGRAYTMAMSATVCQGETNSKIWVRVTHFDDLEELSTKLAESLSNLVYDFYESRAREIEGTLEFRRKFFFNILAAYSTDDGITDVFNILLRSQDPQATFEELRRRDKLSPVARLLKFAHGVDAFSFDDETFRQNWLKSNQKDVGGVTSIAPLSVRQSDAIVLIKADEEKSVLNAWGLCHSDTVDLDSEPPIREAAAQLTGKLASLLAADL
jgi:hypothetical protein